MVRFIASFGLACAAFAGTAVPAAALTPLFTVPAAATMHCIQAPLPGAAAVPARPTRPFAAVSKASAIIGGASAFDQILAQQSASGSLPSAQAVVVRTAAATGSDLTPGAAPGGCNRFALPQSPAFAGAPGARGAGSDDFLRTRRLAVSRTAFDRQWGQASQQSVSRGFLAGKAGLGGLVGTAASEEMLARVNAWTNRQVRYVEDARLFGKADHWAGARTTLRLKAGDCEDIAIVKLQLLAALGVPRSDMYLTIARDLARRADHAVLVVRLGGRYWMLDNATDRLLDADEAYDYQPVLSFSGGRKWLHGAVLAAAL